MQKWTSKSAKRLVVAMPEYGTVADVPNRRWHHT
jgi:hypothetical protein